MTRVVALMMVALTLASCGVQRPLMKPSDIPAYEAEQLKKRERIAQEQREFEEKAAAKKAAEAIKK